MISVLHTNSFLQRVSISLLSKLVRIIPDKLYLKWYFYVKLGYKLDLKKPVTFNQKLQWLKLHDKQPSYTKMVDKVAVKEYVAEKIGDKYIIPTIGVWDRFEDIDFSSLPKQFVLKTSHGGGNVGVYICRDKSHLDIISLRNRFKKAMKQNIYLYYKEWAYKNVPHRLFAEQYLQEDSSGELHDYKVLCFDGIPKLIELHSGRNNGQTHTQDFYTTEWKKTGISQGGYSAVSAVEHEKPSCLSEMLQLSAVLSKGITHCRVDWFVVKEKLFFGEITFFDGGGFCGFDKYEDDVLLGSWINLKSLK